MKSFLTSLRTLFGSAARPAVARKSFRPVMERLEDRQLLAADVTASFENTNGLGVLHIEGTDRADQIVVRQVNGWLSVDGALVNGLHRSVSASAVQVIDVKGLGGDDRIILNSEVNWWQQPIGALCLVDAGIGNDQVFGAAGHNLVSGGEGNDTIQGNGRADFLFGGAGSDRLYGLAGNDYLDGGDAPDVVRGGDGMDVVLGGAGIDILTGDAGNDYLFYDSSDAIVSEGTGLKRNVLNPTQAQREQAISALAASIQLTTTRNDLQSASNQLLVNGLLNSFANPQSGSTTPATSASSMSPSLGSSNRLTATELEQIRDRTYNPGGGGFPSNPALEQWVFSILPDLEKLVANAPSNPSNGFVKLPLP